LWQSGQPISDDVFGMGDMVDFVFGGGCLGDERNQELIRSILSKISTNIKIPKHPIFCVM
jgi:hypothetical protein